MTKIIAELSSNHGGDVDRAREMVTRARWAGCYAVKVQIYQKNDLPDYDPKLNITTVNIYSRIAGACRENKIPLIVSVFGWWAVEWVINSTASPPFAIKLASPESTRLSKDMYRSLARLIKEKRKPLWVSSGLQDWTFMESLGANLFFYCPPGHPSNPPIDELKLTRGQGFSDHSVGIKDAVVASKIGCTHIEKHFKLDDNCVDAKFSLDPDEMKTLCELTK